jgi:hypothetical protein
MSLPIAYTKKALIQRIRKHVSNGFPSDDFAPSENEILLYIDQAVAYTLVGMAYANAKIEGSLAIPEAYILTYKLSGITQDNDTGYWVVDLPQPPISLPLGYSVNQVYFAQNANKRLDASPISNKRLSYRFTLPMPDGMFYWVENQKLWLWATNNMPLINIGNLYVQMPCVRTADVNEVMPLPSDAIQGVFDTVVKELMQRYQVPQDIIKDDLPAGNKSS